MKKVYITALVTALVVLLAFGSYFSFCNRRRRTDSLMVGFICESDESTPYTYNFLLAERALMAEFPDKVTVVTRSNVLENETEDPVRDLIHQGCRILFTNIYSSEYVELARKYPDVEFCQVSFNGIPLESVPENYHSFQGEIYQARYVSGVAAGMKLRDLIDRHYISPDAALVGYVAAFPGSDVISGFTAFLLGVRSVAPEAVMKVKYTNNWGSYNLDRQYTKELIDEGCIVISQHTDTIGPAVACEEAAAKRPVIFVGYNESMLDVAPTTALISARINWSEYICQAVEACLMGEKIERHVDGKAHGNDMCAGFEKDWVDVVDLNTRLAAGKTQETIDRTIAGLEKGSIQVFKGSYTGTDPDDPEDTIDLRGGFNENEKSSVPAFHYILDDIITIEE